MEPIRILHMIGSLNIGGSQTMVLNLYRAINRQKVQFDFVLDHPEERALAEQFEALGAKIYTMPTFRFYNVAYVCRIWDAFFKKHPEYRILHSHVRSYASVYIPIAKKYGVTTIIHSHATSNGLGMTAILKDALQYPLRYQADWFFSCSEEAGEWLYGTRVSNSNHHVVLKNAINAKQYRFSPVVRTRYRQTLELVDKCVYMHVGRFNAAKNHDFLLRAFRQIRDAQEHAVLVCVGDGELRSDIETKIKELYLEEDVILLGNRYDIPELLQAADVFLFPSLYEGLGIAAVEAQAAGLPCLCSPGVPSLAKVMDNCRFVPLDEAAWASAALEEKLDRKDTYEQIMSAGYDIHATADWVTAFYCKQWRE